MAKYNVEVIQPGVTNGTNGMARKYTEKGLRNSINSLNGTIVSNGVDRTMVGEVIDYEYDGGVRCTTVRVGDTE